MLGIYLIENHSRVDEITLEFPFNDAEPTIEVRNLYYRNDFLINPLDYELLLLDGRSIFTKDRTLYISLPASYSRILARNESGVLELCAISKYGASQVID